MNLYILQGSSVNPQDCVPTANSNTKSPTPEASLQGHQAPAKGMLYGNKSFIATIFVTTTSGILDCII